MYELSLTESFVPAQADAAVLDTTVGSCLRSAADAWSDAEALVEITMDGSSGRRWTYQQLLDDSLRLAEALTTRFAKGDRICVWAPNIPEWVLVEYACGFAGIVLVTANPAYQVAELRYVLEQSEAAALFLVSEYRGNPMQAIAAEAADGIDGLREVTDLRDAEALYAHDGPVGPLPEVAPDDAAQIQYTSGTTGFPKGAVLHHQGLTNNARFYAARQRAQQDDVWAGIMPLFHTAGCAMAVLGAVQNGLKLLLVPVFDPVAILKLVEREGMNALLGVPTMLVALVAAQKEMQIDTTPIRVAGSGGSMVAPDLVRVVKETFGCEFVTVYGQTESSPLITMHYRTDTIEDVCSSVGQPMPQTEVSIRSMDDNSVVPVDTQGEICVRGYTVMHGYNNNDEATSAAIDDGGWLHTGDLGAMDARGYVRVTGRVKEMIIRGGENLFPAEIENVLLDHPDVAEVAVVGLPDDKWGEVVACFVRSEAEVDVAALRGHCRARMAPQKTPTVWVSVAAFPLTGSGKIQKFKLAQDFVAGEYTALDA